LDKNKVGDNDWLSQILARLYKLILINKFYILDILILK
jgi:hypothetical protein